MALTKWQMFLHKNKGKYTREELKKMYHKLSPKKGRGRVSRGKKSTRRYKTPRKSNRWVQFEKMNKGKYTHEELVAAYHRKYPSAGRRSPRRSLSPRSRSSYARGRNPNTLKALARWREEEHEFGGKGLHREEFLHDIHEKYGSPRYGRGMNPHSLDALRTWRAFEHEEKGKGMHPSQIQAAFHEKYGTHPREILRAHHHY